MDIFGTAAEDLAYPALVPHSCGSLRQARLVPKLGGDMHPCAKVELEQHWTEGARMHGSFIYIDESGHTGDLLTSGKQFNFNGQPHFILAAVGPISPELAKDLLDQVVQKHRLQQMQEVKSEALAKRPGVAKDLANALREKGIPIFIEAVDKVYYLIISIVNHHILPTMAGTRLDEADRFVRNYLADYLYQAMPDSVLDAFIEACRKDSPEAVRTSLEVLLAWAREPGADEKETRALDLIAKCVVETIDDLERAMGKSSDGYRNFLPLPDAGKRDSIYWMLPNYASLTCLYARVNHCLRGEVGGVSLVHDDQSQYEEVLRSAKAAVEAFEDPTEYVHMGADFRFSEKAELSFAISAQTPGLMIADVLAGQVRRVLREHMDDKDIHEMALDAFLEIWDCEDEERGTGIRLVLPMATVQRLQHLVLERRRSRRQDDSTWQSRTSEA